jgi:hypothetical protein
VAPVRDAWAIAKRKDESPAARAHFHAASRIVTVETPAMLPICLDWRSKGNLCVGLGRQSRYFPLMTIDCTWSRRHAMVHFLALCLIVQALLTGLHAARFVDQKLTASDPSICHGSNTAPTPLRSDLPDTCCLLGCTLAGQTGTLPEQAILPSVRIISVPITHQVKQLTFLRSHLRDRAHSRPRSPPSA